MTDCVFPKVHPVDAKRTQDSSLQIFFRSKMAAQQFSSENFGKNLEFTRAVHEALAWRFNCPQCDTVTVPIGDSSAMKSEYWLDASGKAQEVADGDVFLVRLVGPLGDRVLYGFIEIQDTILLSGDSGHTPKPLGAAENRGDPVPAIATGITLIEDATVLNHQQRQATVGNRVLLCCRASALRDVSIRGSERAHSGSQKHQRTNHSHEAAIVTVAGTKIKGLVKVRGRDELPLVRVFGSQRGCQNRTKRSSFLAQSDRLYRLQKGG